MQFAKRNQIPPWWDEPHLKKRWRAYSLSRKNEKVTFLWDVASQIDLTFWF
jgi:hypothetical protein